MIRRELAGIVLSIDDRAPEDIMRWVRELPEAGPEAPDLVWQPERAADHQPVSRRADGSILCSGADHNLLALVQALLVERSSLLVHGGAFEFEGVGVVVIGGSGAGKTVTTLAALADERLRLLSDDLCVVTPGGRVTAFPTAVALRAYHHPLLSGAPVGRIRRLERRSLAFALLSRIPGARAVGRRLRDAGADSDGRSASWLRGAKTDFVVVPTRSLFPQARLLDHTEARVLVVLERSEAAGVSSLAHDHAAERMLTSLLHNEGIGAALTRYAAAGVLDDAEHLSAARNVARAFCKATPLVVEVAPPPSPDPAEVQRYVLAAIERSVAQL